MADDYSDEEEGEILHIDQVTPPNTDRGKVAQLIEMLKFNIQ